MEQITAKEKLKKHFSLLSDEDKLPDNVTLEEMAKVLDGFAALRSVSEASYNAYKEVTDDAIKVLNKEVDDAMGICDELRLPSNGKEGCGKRESLTLSQRLKYLLPVSEVGQITDEEIEKEYSSRWGEKPVGTVTEMGFVSGAKWYREELKKRLNPVPSVKEKGENDA